MAIVLRGLCLTLVLLFVGQSLPGGAEELFWFDSRLLLLAHPLMQQFDPATGRFADTSSAMVTGGEAGQKKLEAEIADTRTQLEKLKADYLREAHTLQGSSRQRADQNFLRAKGDLQQRVAALEQRSIEVTGVPGRPGMTGYAAIRPQVQRLTEDIRKVVLLLKTRFRAAGVLDVASLIPLHPSLVPPPDAAVLHGNRHFLWWRGTGNKDPLNQPWIAEAKRFWARHPGWTVDPVPLGGKDFCNGSLQLLQTISGGTR